MRMRIDVTTRSLVRLLIVIGPVIPSAAADGQKYRLRYQFDAGQSVRFTVEDQSHVMLQKGQAVQHIDHGSVMDKRYIVRSVDADGNAELDLQIDRVRTSVSEDGADAVTFDSDSDEEPPTPLKGISETVGKPHARVKISPTGHLHSIDWLVGADNAPKPTLKDAAKLDILVILPDEPVAVGQTWKQPFETAVGTGAKLRKSVKLQREYTLANVEGDSATIALKTSVLTPLHDPAHEFQLISRLFRGTIEFDLRRGVVVSRTLNVDRVVVGFEGADSKARNVTTKSERLAPQQTASDVPTDTARQ